MAPPALIADLLAFLACDNPSDEAFNRQALALFAHQFQHNLPFQRFCQQRGKTLRTVKSWRNIPAVPISAFKALTLSCISPDQAERSFMTSGTTQAEVKGKHHHPTLVVYDASMIRNFRQRFMAGGGRIRMGILFPDETLLPNSSLAHYLALAVREFGTQASHYLLTQQGLDTPRVIAELERAEQTGEPYALLGASYSFVHLLDELQRLGRTFNLPAGSRVLDTGGFKGRSRELSMQDFYAQLSVTLGIPASQCINMYGMTELSTQFYDDGNATLPSVKSGPHWIRSRVVEPLSGEELPRGQQGILAHCDLANFNSVTTILTEDVGLAVDGGFLLLGRAQGSAAKGCSLAVEEFLQAAAA
ncbi:MAG: long-chain fatty acid--CoA ligase [Polaromonas sp.]|uniref:LuxE/PaaK family acyltransferase n=1 Tax=Polaromonas sp. TaxID=1869339 RepID=UPI002735075D|nr:long-chain fatty acid--CoA ligase [Polaromonas sp.]MDP2819333.1 long-chain fatty acid--CoA ligase [Polaromonas sp.]